MFPQISQRLFNWLDWILELDTEVSRILMPQISQINGTKNRAYTTELLNRAGSEFTWSVFIKTLIET